MPTRPKRYRSEKATKRYNEYMKEYMRKRYKATVEADGKKYTPRDGKDIKE